MGSTSAIQPKVATDLPVYTPGELERLAEESSFVCQAVLGVRVAYEKDSRRRANWREAYRQTHLCRPTLRWRSQWQDKSSTLFRRD